MASLHGFIHHSSHYKSAPGRPRTRPRISIPVAHLYCSSPGLQVKAFQSRFVHFSSSASALDRWFRPPPGASGVITSPVMIPIPLAPPFALLCTPQTYTM